MKIVVGQKILNLEELFNISNFADNAEVIIDSQIFADLNKNSEKEQPAVQDFPDGATITNNLPQDEIRAMLTVKLIQLLKLK